MSFRHSFHSFRPFLCCFCLIMLFVCMLSFSVFLFLLVISFPRFFSIKSFKDTSTTFVFVVSSPSLSPPWKVDISPSFLWLTVWTDLDGSLRRSCHSNRCNEGTEIKKEKMRDTRYRSREAKHTSRMMLRKCHWSIIRLRVQKCYSSSIRLQCMVSTNRVINRKMLLKCYSYSIRHPVQTNIKSIYSHFERTRNRTLQGPRIVIKKFVQQMGRTQQIWKICGMYWV